MGKLIEIFPYIDAYTSTGKPRPIQISKILEPYAFEKESTNFPFEASLTENIVSGILEAIAAIINAPKNKFKPRLFEICSVAKTKK